MSRWWRAYDDALNNPKLQRLSAALFRSWFNLCCLSSKNGGSLPALDVIAFALRCSEPQAARIIADLKAAGLVDSVGEGFEMHDWKDHQYQSDSSTERVKRFRERSKEVSETPPETEQNTEQKQIGADAPSKNSPGRSRRGNKTPIPEGLTLGDDWLSEGTRRGISGENIRLEFQKFCSRAKRDDARYVNWSQAWSNWLDNAIGYNPKLVTAQSAQVVSIEDERKVWETLLEKFKRTGTWPSQRIPAPGTAGCPIPAEMIARYQPTGADA